MKIVFIGQKGIPAKNGGVERYVESLALNLSQKGHEVLVYSRRNYSLGLKEYKGVKVISLPSLPGKNFEAITHTFLACLDLIFRPVDVIHFQSIGPASLMWLVKILKPRTPIVFTFHCQDYYHQKWGRLARWYLKFGEKIGCLWADKIITISKELNNYVTRVYQKQALYIPNGATISELMPVQDIRRFGLEENNYLVAVSRLVRHKGLQYLIAAYKNLKTDKKLVIVGGSAYTDDYVQELHEMAKDNPNIIFTGNQSGRALAELYSNAYAFVQPSESEGLSISLLEAMSYGRACVVSDIEANQEALAGTGLIFKDKDINDLQSKLEFLLANSEEIAKFGQAALKRVKAEYDWQNIVSEIEKVYNELAPKKQLILKKQFVK
ncbi:MAG: glycosyltransferase family 4 protein [Patescibacteria group bacterium]